MCVCVYVCVCDMYIYIYICICGTQKSYGDPKSNHIQNKSCQSIIMPCFSGRHPLEQKSVISHCACRDYVKLRTRLP